MQKGISLRFWRYLSVSRTRVEALGQIGCHKPVKKIKGHQSAGLPALICAPSQSGKGGTRRVQNPNSKPLNFPIITNNKTK